MKPAFDREEQQDQTDGKLVVALEKLAEVFRVLLWEQTKIHGLSPIQVQILIFLQNHEQALAKPAVLAQELNVTRPTISDAIRSLTRKEMIEIRPNPEDSRSRLLSLSPKAVELTKELLHFSDPLQRALGMLDKNEQSTMLQNLLSLLNQLEKTEVINPQRMCFNCAFYEGDRQEKHYCNFLEKSLSKAGLRIDCPEHKAA